MKLMYNNLITALHTLVFSIEDTTFYGQKKLIDYMIGDPINLAEKQRQFHYDYLQMMKNKSQFRSIDELNLLLYQFQPHLFQSLPIFSDLDKNGGSEERAAFRHYDELFTLLQDLSHTFLTHIDGRLSFKYWNTTITETNKIKDIFSSYPDDSKLYAFHRLAQIIYLDIISIMYYIQNKEKDIYILNGFYQNISLVDAQLNDILEKGVAENHVHASSAFNYSTLWFLLMNDKVDDPYYHSYREATYSSASFKKKIAMARLQRLLMSLYLQQLTQTGERDIKGFYDYCDDIDIQHEKYRNMLCVLIQTEKFDQVDLEHITFYIEYLEAQFVDGTQSTDSDYIFSIFIKHHDLQTNGENILLFYALTYLKNTKEKDKLHFIQLSDVFYRYISIKNEIYHSCIQPADSIKGLDYFKIFFGNSTDGFDYARNGYLKKTSTYYEYLFQTMFQNPYLRKLELRLAVAKDKFENKLVLKKLLSSYRKVLNEIYRVEKDPQASFPRIGIVYHLIKDSDTIKNKCVSLINPSEYEEKINYAYFGEIQARYQRQIALVNDIRNEVAGLSTFIVGIDAANLENITPVNIFAPVFNAARNSDSDKFFHVDDQGQKVYSPTLFFTFHAGEDFRHILSGLRRIDEAIVNCKFHSGDRIGHGIVLGINVDSWAVQHQAISITRGEYLDNLIWSYTRLIEEYSINANVILFLEKEIDKQIEYIFGQDIFRRQDLISAYKERFKLIKDYLRGLENHNGSYSCICQIESSKIDNEGVKAKLFKKQDLLLSAYHCTEYLEKLEEPTIVSTTGIVIDVMEKMQQYVVDKVAREGIVIEVNPSSNEVIGEMNSFYDNQIFKLYKHNNDNFSNVIVNINTDNPIVCNSNVANEIALIYYALQSKGVGKADALDWIDKIRKFGLDTSFIRSTVSNVEYLRQLDYVIEHLNGE